MAQGNMTWHRGDLTGDIYFDYLHLKGGQTIPYIRLYLMVDGTPEAKPIKGLRILAYGMLAEVVYGHVQKGSRIGIEGHVQLRYRPNHPTPVFEIVAERIEFIRNIDYERGKKMIEELKGRDKGKITANDQALIDEILASEGLGGDDEFIG